MTKREAAKRARDYDRIVHLIVDRLHVGASDAEVRAAVLGKMSPKTREAHPKLAAAVADRAVKIHHANGLVYARVMSGRL